MREELNWIIFSMKKFALIFSVLFVIYTIAWFVIANIAEKKIHATIEDLKTSGTIKSYSGDIDITGYPFKFTVRLEYPNIQFTPNNYKADYNFLYDGNVRITLGLFSNSIKIKTNGNLHLKGFINDYNFHLVSSGEDNFYEVKLHDFLLSPTLITNIVKAGDSTKDLFFEVIKSIHLRANNLKLVNKLNNELILNIEETNLELKTKHSGEYKIHYQEEDKNAEFGRESMVLWNHLKTIPQVKKIVNKIPDNIKHYLDAFQLYQLGLINCDTEVDISTDLSKNTVINIDKFLLKDQIEDISLKGKLEFHENKTLINIASTMRFEEKWYQLMKKYAKSAEFSNFNLSFFGKTNEKSILSSILSPMNKFMNTILGDKAGEQGAAYVPKLHEMGVIKSEIKIHQHSKPNKDFKLDIDNVHISTNQYELGASGNFENEEGADIYKIDLEVKNYPKLVDIAAGYINRIAKASHYNFLISGEKLDISDKTAQSIKALIRKVSNNPEASEINAQINLHKKKQDKYPAVGKYSPTEFEDIWKKFVTQLIFEKLSNTIDKYMNNKLLKNDLTVGAAKGVTDTFNTIFEGVQGAFKKDAKQ